MMDELSLHSSNRTPKHVKRSSLAEIMSDSQFIRPRENVAENLKSRFDPP